MVSGFGLPFFLPYVHFLSWCAMHNVMYFMHAHTRYLVELDLQEPVKESVNPQARREDDRSSLSSSQTTPTATLPLSDYRQKYRHLIGGLECAEKTAVRMEPNRSFGYGELLLQAQLNPSSPDNVGRVWGGGGGGGGDD